MLEANKREKDPLVLVRALLFVRAQVQRERERDRFVVARIGALASDFTYTACIKPNTVTRCSPTVTWKFLRVELAVKTVSFPRSGIVATL